MQWDWVSVLLGSGGARGARLDASPLAGGARRGKRKNKSGKVEEDKAKKTGRGIDIRSLLIERLRFDRASVRPAHRL